MTALLSSFELGDLLLPSRVVMAPLTRRRAGPGKLATPLMATHYGQRAGAALIISESTEVDPLSAGEPSTRPGIFNSAQEASWRLVTDAVHLRGGRIFMQLSHMGRTAHPSQRIGGAIPVAPTAIVAEGKVFTPTGPQPYVLPRALETSEIPDTVAEFTEAARRARAAGFDGIELHGANGYLIDQFLRDGSNRRQDGYGGSLANRARFLIEAIEGAKAHWPAGRIGVRVSPTIPFQDMRDSDPVAHFVRLAELLNGFGLAYLHLIEGPVPAAGEPELRSHLRRAFRGPLMVAGGYTATTAEETISSGGADLVAFGEAFIANPDLPERLRINAVLNPVDKSTFYSGGPRGYTDYPALADAPGLVPSLS